MAPKYLLNDKTMLTTSEAKSVSDLLLKTLQTTKPMQHGQCIYYSVFTTLARL